VAINIKFRVFAIKENALASKVCRGNIGAVALADRDKLRFFHSQVKSMLAQSGKQLFLPSSLCKDDINQG
jgi:hypothetical protein